MFIRQWGRFGVPFVLGAAILNCSAPPETDPDATNPSGDDGHVGTAASAATALPPRCYGKMLLPAPYDDPDQPVGMPMTVRINRACDRGAPLVDRKMRVYVRSAEVGQAVGPQLMLKDWTDVGATQYRLDIPWTAGRLADGSTLPPGRYQMYSYSLNSSLYDDWAANEPYARAMSTRSDNTYVTLKAAGTWVSEDWGECSASCDGGTQSRTNKCQASGVDVAARYCLAAAPETSQSCNESACGPTPEELCTEGGGTWTDGACVTTTDVGAMGVNGTCGVMGVQGPGFMLSAGPSQPLPAGTTIMVTGSGVANIGVWSVTGATASVAVLSPTSRQITLLSPLAAGTTAAFRTTLSISVAFRLNGSVSLPDGYVASGAKMSGAVSSTLILCSGS